MRGFIVGIIGLTLVVGCKKDQPKAEKPAEEPKTAVAPTPADPVPQESDKADDSVKVGPKDSGSPKVAAPLATPDRLERPKLPEVPKDNLLLVARQAATQCKANQAVCPARDQLAAKIVAELEAATKLRAEGTDHQKSAIRAALLRSWAPETDALLLSYLIGPDGALDAAVLSVAVSLGMSGLVPLLIEYLKKAVGQQARIAIEALGEVGGPDATKELIALLGAEQHRPWKGAVCRGLGRAVVNEQLEKIVALSSEPGALPQVVEGCRGAEGALRLLKSASQISLNVEARQIPVGAVLLTQPTKDPLSIHMSISQTPGATCDNPGEIKTVLSAKLDRNGDPIVGSGVNARLIHDGQDLGTGPVYLLRFDELEMKAGAAAKGTVHAAIIRAKLPRIIMSGHFTATWCGAR